MYKFSIVILTFSFLLVVNSGIGIIFAQQLASNYDFSFVAAGDWGCDERAQSTAKNMQNKTPDLVIALGDLSYQKDADCWLKIMNPLLNRTVIAIGDHEFHFKNSTRLDEYMNVFHLKNQFYSFDHKNAHFLAMSAEIPFDKKSDQFKFVNSDLETASKNGSIDWIVVFMYEMMYSSSTFHKSNENLRIHTTHYLTSIMWI